ncbi:MAG: heat-inducible transcription repressor HrcA [Elusimicrobia bacterium RIFCSPLOWO2_02_FULL_39_32]|nr:MAG: heat-inducible transcription repressor HrcA [Elusimicrobia bacterium GWA2_38_7]OGR79591.1 MAG: heat-inducible transcription repressor HrcA [Elusimicrobia bacterium RIFCSPHIGHO2_02_FULL_39_36]OGR92918.1 MAG: heat-inducible transcription repressor HrcA [Elusimicrobia bacterium RIFCSPLOWO2_02_FULL_39_32]OGR99701.1 MAG: heat-inducible transcription repressor HrcA [Elusimicrobia bacterium RIFCSPLOWO2_12_FULL_39_28]
MRALNQEEIEERKKKVLQYVIHEHIRTGKPVGSHSISNTSRLGLSSASIRHTLFELEKSGMIAQPHASAGRIPTDKGYRLYVDSLVEMQRLAVQEQVRIQTEYEARIKEVEDFMSQTSRMLSTLSHYTGFVMTPKWEKNIFSCLELVPITNKRILCAMITESGLAKHFTINTQIEIPKEHLRKIARIINQNFQGSTLENVKLKLVECLENLQEETKEIFSLAREIGEEIKKFSSGEIYLEGASNILSLPDFSGAADLQNLLKVIEEKQILTNILEHEILEDQKSQNSKEQIKTKNLNDRLRTKSEHSEPKKIGRVHVRIGSENLNKALQNLSVISSTYQLADKTVGVLGILGPKRMEYPKMISLVDYVSQMVNKMLKELEER